MSSTAQHSVPRTGVEGAASQPRAKLAEELSTIAVLVRRDLTRFAREKSRVAGALLQPLLFWLMIGAGMAGTFVLPGAHGVSYLEYFYPGVLVMVVLFTAIFTTMSVIEDRHSGFLQAVLVAPGSRAALVIGKCLGAASVAFAHGLLFALLAPVAGFGAGHVDWALLFAALALSCFGLCALGFAVAWWLDSTAGYHVVMSVLLLPLWILSGAMFPAGDSRVIAWLQRGNPMAYSVSAVRRALYAGHAPAGTGLGSSALVELGVLVAFCALAAALSVRVCNARR
jgi:daunorubicin resistance ABC transporter membrane protein